jgi:predicted transcriptional regulator
VITIPTLVSALHLNFPPAQRYVDQLCALGILREVTGKARNRVYVAEEILRAVQEPLAGQALQGADESSPEGAKP